MFDLRADTTRVKSNNAAARMDEDIDYSEYDEKPDHVLDSTENRDLHDKLISYYRTELDKQADNRQEQATEEDYYDNIQLTDEELAELKEREQMPVIYNVTAQTINWITGSERRNRTDFKVLPRRKEESISADKKTNLLKYLSDVNRTPFSRSRAFEDCVKVGVGWLETGIQDESEEEPIFSRYEGWRNMLHDSNSSELDDDARYLFRVKWVDVDVAQAFFPDRANVIDEAAASAQSYGNYTAMDGDEAMDFKEFDLDNASRFASAVTHYRPRCRLIECWYRKPENVKRFKEGPYKGHIFDPNDSRHHNHVTNKPQSLGEKIVMCMRVAIMTHSRLLHESPSPYRHNKFPFTPIWGNRRGRDGLPYGTIRWIKSIQDDINKRAMKALHILSSNKVVMEKGAIDAKDMPKFFDEVARADAVIEKNKGYSLELDADRELAPAHLDLMSRNIQMVQQVGGVTDEQLGRSTNAVSGVAVEARQMQGAITNSKYFDNLRYSEQIRGEKELSLIEQYMTEKKEFRITNQRGNADFVTVNDGLPENDIARTKADFVISEQDWQASVREANTKQLIDLLKVMPPEVALVMLDLVVDTMDVHNRDEIVKRIRQMTGQRDPDQVKPTPEEIQAQQEQQAQQQEQQAQQRALFEANLSLIQAKAQESQANVSKNSAAAAKTQSETVANNVKAQSDAMIAATAAVTLPAIAPVADAILKESGWVSPLPGLPLHQLSIPARVGILQRAA